VDELVCRDTLYEVVGCYFEKFTDAYGKSTEPVTISFGGRSDVSRPTMFYYALLRTKSGDSGKSVTECSSDELQCVAFCIRHTMEKEHKPQANDMMSISDLEKLTGFRYFTNVPQAPKDTFNPSDWL
jgi:DNA/RNA endonuclease G (NUC1)